MATARRDRACRVAALCAAATLTLAAACGGDDSDDDDAGSSSTTTEASDTTAPPTTAPPTPEEAAEAVYLELVDVVYRLGTTEPDPDDADLARLTTDPALGYLRDSFSTMQAEHHIVQPGPRSSHRVMSVAEREPGVVVLRDCSVGNDTTIDRDDGAVVGQGLSTRVLEATITSIEGQWRVSAIDTIERFDGEVPCPE
jgi:hypothetical protein